MDVALPRRSRAKRMPDPASAPAFHVTNEIADWSKWQQQLVRRKPRVPAAGAGPLGGTVMLWGAADCLDADGRTLLTDIQRSLQKNKLNPLARSLQNWVSAGQTTSTVQTALEAIAWTFALPALAQVMERDAWCSAVDAIHNLAAPASLSPQEQPLVYQLRAVELPATLARQFPEFSFAGHFASSATAASATLLASALDEDGLLQSDRLSLVRPLLASWVRCRRLEAAGAAPIFDDTGRSRLDKFYRLALRLTRANGSQVFGSQKAFEPSFLEAVEQTATSSTTRRIVQAIQSTVAGQPEKGLPPAPSYSEKRGLALLRTRWSPPTDCASVRFFAAEVDAEWQAGGRVLGSGAWSWQATVNGQPLQADGNWEEVCWHSDDDVDYLELELPLSGGWVLQRQVLLARSDRFLYLADVLIGNDVPQLDVADLSFTSSWPLLEGVRFEPARETREGHFTVGGKRVACAMPISLPEWRVEMARGELQCTAEGELQLSVAGRGRNLYCPLWIDLDARRCAQPATWRRLTVAQHLETMRSDTAVGYRVQSGAQNWIFYRSLAERASRTVLGQNYVGEFIAARFQRDGQTVELIEIE